MGEQLQTTPLIHRQITPINLFSTSTEKVASCTDTRHLNLLLADVTSLILLSTGDDNEGAVPSVRADLERRLVEHLKNVTDEFDQEPTEKPPRINTPMHKSLRGQSSSMSADVKRSYEHLLLAANSSSQSAVRPRSDLVSLQSAADSNITDRPLCMTFDSGIASPGFSTTHGNTDVEYHPLIGDKASVTKDLHQRLNHLKMSVEQRLRECMSSSIQTHDANDGLSDVCGHLGHPGSSSAAPDLFADRALARSLLEFENTKLSAQVAYLEKKVEILEDIAGTQGINMNAMKLSMETISIGSQTDEQHNQALTLDDTDFGISDLSQMSPETNHLMSSMVCKDEDFQSPSGMSTPGTTTNKRPGLRRKIEVPTQLKDFSAGTSTSYLSISAWGDMDDKQNGSTVGCWKGLFTCCYRPQ